MMGKACDNDHASQQEQYVVFDVHQARPLFLIEFICQMH